MDRLVHMLPRRMTLPLATLALVGLGWLFFRTAVASPIVDRLVLQVGPPGRQGTPEKGTEISIKTVREGPAVREVPSDPQPEVTGPKTYEPPATPLETSKSLAAPPETRGSLTALPQTPKSLTAVPQTHRSPAVLPPTRKSLTAPPQARKPLVAPLEAHKSLTAPLKTDKPPTASLAGPVEPPQQKRVARRQPPRPLQAPVPSHLLPPEKPAGRSAQLEDVAQQADRRTRRGFELAGRRAYYAARAEFIRALRLVAQGLDTEHQTTTHSRSLAAGLTAIKEAEDFLPEGSRLEADLDIPSILGRHRTPVLKDSETENLTSLLVLKCYFTFAQEQLAAAVGHEIAGSMALHALGKLHAALVDDPSCKIRAAEPKAMAFYQAALMAFPYNYLAANDLGVLLTTCGDYHQAQATLLHSLSIHGQSTGWHNLAVVHQQLGQEELARQADQKATAARRAEKAGRNPASQTVRWVDPELFAQTHTKNENPWQATPSQPKPAKAGSSNQPADPPAKASLTGWWPWGSQAKRK